MAKLNLKATTAATGIGTFVEKTIRFNDKDGKEMSGEILVRIPSYEEFTAFTDVFADVEKSDLKVGQITRSFVFGTIYETEKKKFFSKIEETASEVTPEIISAMYEAADAVIDFSGKNWISITAKKSGTNLSVVESAGEQLQKQSGT